ncbi:Polyprotein P3-like protein [Drosera capensis]
MKNVAETSPGKRMLNRLFNKQVQIEVGSLKPFTLTAIVDTGATTCCADINSIPKEAIEELSYSVHFNGLNSQNLTNKRIRNGVMRIEDNSFRMTFTYVFAMENKSGIQMLLGCNFIRSMVGGCRFEGNKVTFYKSITTISTSMEISEQAKLGLEEICDDLPLEIQESVWYTSPYDNEPFRQRNAGLMKRLTDNGFIDLTIQDKPLKHVTPAMEDAFKRHVTALLEIGVIRPSKSRHRTMAIMVNSGTTVDPITKREIRGKERMVFNYRSVNDNTYKDQYSLPGINTILKRIGNSRIYSKFDLKSGFHQVMMAEESIPWTAFYVPGGLYEWLVMPFGLKNAPATFQRKMDACFQHLQDFIAVYIDDILIFSTDEQEHQRHLQKFVEVV